MFTGIIECMGEVVNTSYEGSNMKIFIQAPILPELKIDQSIAHNGVCLTVDYIGAQAYSVTAVAETLAKTNLTDLKPGDKINLERCLPVDGRIDGHFVQGHIDGVVICNDVITLDGSWLYDFEFDPQFAALIVEKGAVALNGVSLTTFNITDHTFRVAIIPYTYAHTNFSEIRPGSRLNVEFDILGKYLQRYFSLYNPGR